MWRECCHAGLDSLRDICTGKEGDVELELDHVGSALKFCSPVLLEQYIFPAPAPEQSKLMKCH